MMETKKKYLKLILKIIVPILLFIAVILGCEIRLSDGGLYVGNPLFNSYAYTVYSDHVVLEQFKGEEQEEIVIPTTIWGKPVTTIGWECFQQCNNIKKVVLHEEIEVIEGYAFWGCDNLTEVVGGSNVYQIGTQAFKVCRSLEVVELGSDLEVIELGAFEMCESLKKMEPQEHLLLIENSAFRESGLEEFVFNNDVKMGSSVFMNTPWLSAQEVEFLIYGDGQLVWYSESNNEIIIPEGVKTLLWGCFEDITSADIYLPDTVTKIEEFTFIACEDVKVYIPETVTKMGNEERDCSIANNDAHITIVTIKDSYAHQYAIDHDIPYEIVESW